MFLLRNKKDISIFRMKKAPYLLLCDSVELNKGQRCFGLLHVPCSFYLKLLQQTKKSSHLKFEIMRVNCILAIMRVNCILAFSCMKSSLSIHLEFSQRKKFSNKPKHMMCNIGKRSLCHLRTAKVQCLCNHAV